MKKKTLANLIMITIIAGIMLGGVLGVGYIQGWFDTNDGSHAVLAEIKGVIRLHRDGVSYPVEDDTVLRDGDRLFCESGAAAVIRIGNSRLAITEKAELMILSSAVQYFSAEVAAGEIFTNCTSPVCLCFDDRSVQFQNAVTLLSVRSGAQSISVFKGNVAEAAEGQIVNYVGEEVSVTDLQITSLNDFAMRQIRLTNQTISLCFTNDQLDKLEEDRKNAMQDLIDSLTPTVTPTEPTPTEPDTSEPDNTEPTPSATLPDQEIASYVYICIRCDTILDNMENLNPGKVEFVPADGEILPMVSIYFYEGETVFEVLNRVCEIFDIQIEYSWTPLYDSYYIEGINHLYEFDCGVQSGWMYKVNEWFPNYGCSSYVLEDGDVIEWLYTCNGLGADVGGPEWME